MSKFTNRLKATAIAGALAVATGCAVMAADTRGAKVIEYVTFKAKAGVSTQALAEAAAGGAVNANLKANYAGFVERYVSLQDDGVWVEVVLWQSKAAAKAALDKFVTDPANRAFLDLVDADSVSISYSRIQ